MDQPKQAVTGPAMQAKVMTRFLSAMLSGFSPPARKERGMGEYLGDSWVDACGRRRAVAPVRAGAWVSLLRENKTALWFLNLPRGFLPLPLGGLLPRASPCGQTGFA